MQVAISVPQLEREMLQMPQAEAPVVHRFGPGIYIREVSLRAGTIAIGHAQRLEHTNLMLTGAVAMLDPDTGAVRVLRAPLFFVGKPGRKIGYVLEDTVWQNIYATEERDVDRLEAMFLDKSAGWSEQAAQEHALQRALLVSAREDFFDVITAAGFTPEQVREQSEATHDLMPMPPAYEGLVTIRPSAIEGHGVFAASPIAEGTVIGPARWYGMRTPIGRFTNHHPNPNALFHVDHLGNVWAVALRPIRGCHGGDAGEEITIDYRQALALSGLWPPTQGAQAA
jgi:hypothetical protein